MMLENISKYTSMDNVQKAEKYRKAMYVGIKAFENEVPLNDN